MTPVPQLHILLDQILELVFGSFFFFFFFWQLFNCEFVHISPICIVQCNICFSPSGIFVALALRFDVSRGKDSQYFKSAFLGYGAGLVLTIIVMNWFQAAQVTIARSSLLYSYS